MIRAFGVSLIAVFLLLFFPFPILAQSTCAKYDTNFQGGVLDTTYWKSSVTNQGSVTQSDLIDIQTKAAGSYAGISTLNARTGDFSTEINVSEFNSTINNANQQSNLYFGLLDKPYGVVANNQIDIQVTKVLGKSYLKVITLEEGSWKAESPEVTFSANTFRLKIAKEAGFVKTYYHNGSDYVLIAQQKDIFPNGAYIGFSGGTTGTDPNQFVELKISNFLVSCLPVATEVSKPTGSTTSAVSDMTENKSDKSTFLLSALLIANVIGLILNIIFLVLNFRLRKQKVIVPEVKNNNPPTPGV